MKARQRRLRTFVALVVGVAAVVLLLGMGKTLWARHAGTLAHIGPLHDSQPQVDSLSRRAQ